jgi:phage tail sheath protein FI
MTSNLQVGLNMIDGQAPQPIIGVSSGVCCIVGNFARGLRGVPQSCPDRAAFERLCGPVPLGDTTSFYSALGLYANAGQGDIWVLNIASSAAAKATKTVVDRQTPTPEDTLTITARSEGNDGEKISYEIADNNILVTKLLADIAISAISATVVSIGGLEVGSIVNFDDGVNDESVVLTEIDPNTNTIQWVGGLTNGYLAADTAVASQEFTLTIYYDSNFVKRYEGLTMFDAPSFHAIKIVNADANRLVELTDEKTTELGPDDLPAVTTDRVPLAGGEDGIDDVEASDYLGSASTGTGIHALKQIPNLFRVALCDIALTDVDAEAALVSVVQGLLNLANTEKFWHIYASVPAGKTQAEANTFGLGFEGRRLQMYYPNGNINLGSETVSVPLAGHSLGARLRIDREIGVHQSIGNARLNYLTSLETELSQTEITSLADVGVIAVSTRGARGIRVFGAVTRSAEPRWKFTNVAEQWSYYGSNIIANTEDLVMKPITPQLMAEFKRRCDSFFATEHKRGALYDPANPSEVPYMVICDSTVNQSADDLAAGILVVYIEYSPVVPAERIKFVLTSSPTGVTIRAAA